MARTPAIKKLTPAIIEKVETEVMMLLFSERDCYVNRLGNNLKKMPERFMIAGGGGYHAEALGIMRALDSFGYCYHGASNTPASKINSCWWFSELEDRCLREEAELTIRGGLEKYRQLNAHLQDRVLQHKLRIAAEDEAKK